MARFDRADDTTGQYMDNEPVVALALVEDNGARKVVGLIATSGVLQVADDTSWGEGASQYTFRGYYVLTYQ